jgi:hypothetical protein
MASDFAIGSDPCTLFAINLLPDKYRRQNNLLLNMGFPICDDFAAQLKCRRRHSPLPFKPDSHSRQSHSTGSRTAPLLKPRHLLLKPIRDNGEGKVSCREKYLLKIGCRGFSRIPGKPVR